MARSLLWIPIGRSGATWLRRRDRWPRGSGACVGVLGLVACCQPCRRVDRRFVQWRQRCGGGRVRLLLSLRGPVRRLERVRIKSEPGSDRPLASASLVRRSGMPPLQDRHLSAGDLGGFPCCRLQISRLPMGAFGTTTGCVVQAPAIEKPPDPW